MKRATRNDESKESEKDKKRRWAAHFQVSKQRRPAYGTVDASHPEGSPPNHLSALWAAYASMWNGCLSGYPWSSNGLIYLPYTPADAFSYFPHRNIECGSTRTRRITGVRINMSLDWPALLDTVPSDFNSRFDYPQDKKTANSPTELVLFSTSDMPPYEDSEDLNFQSYLYEDTQFPTTPGGSELIMPCALAIRCS